MHNLLPTPISPRPDIETPASAELALMLLGPSTAMSHLWGQIRRLAPYARLVLLTGSPESGQEAVARLLLDLSPLPRRPFISLDPAEAEDRLRRHNAPGSIPHEVLLFLPEIDRLAPAAQDSLLHLLRQRRSRALSMVASTAEDLRALVSVGRFSAELAEALGSVRLAVPSLSERLEDLPMLLNQMFALRCHPTQRAIPALGDDLLRAAMQHPWPGNLRELSGVVEELLHAYQPGAHIGAEDLRRAIAVQQAPRSAAPAVRMIKLDTVVREHIYAVLRGCRGNKLRAAEVLGISRSTLYRMLDAAAQNGPMQMAS